MANKEQVEIVRQGGEAWNKWREKNPDAKIDLCGAKLDGYDLCCANFRRADMRAAIIRNCNLEKADFSEADMRRAKLDGMNVGGKFKLLLNQLRLVPRKNSSERMNVSDANFRKAKVCATIFRNCNLRKADFSKADIHLNFNGLYVRFTWIVSVTISTTILFPYHIISGNFFIPSQWTFYILTTSPFLGYLLDIFAKKYLYMPGVMSYKTDFSGSDLSYAKFKYTKFEEYLFSDSCKNTILADKDVREFLTTGEIQKRSLKGKNLKSTCLVNFNLREVDLRETNLSQADLRKADIKGADLRKTDLRQADLSGADITGTKLWGSARENWIINGIRCDYFYWDEAGKKRIPPEDDQNFYPGEFEERYKQLPTFEYIFEQGFTPLDPLIMDRVVHAINERHKDFKLDLVNFDKHGHPHATFTVCHLDYIDEAKEEVVQLYERIIEYLERENEDKKKKINKLEDFIDQLIKKISSLEGVKMGDTYNIYGGQVGALGKRATATRNIFQQISPNDLSQLHEEMQKKAETPDQKAATEEVAKAEQAARQQDEQTMQQHLKNAGQWALDCAQQVGTDVLTEYLKKITLG